MARYFFHIREGDTFIEDFDGEDLPDLAAARAEALAAARDLLAERLRAGKVLNGHFFEITDESGAIVEKIMFRDAMRLPSEK